MAIVAARVGADVDSSLDVQRAHYENQFVNNFPSRIVAKAYQFVGTAHTCDLTTHSNNVGQNDPSKKHQLITHHGVQ